MLENASDRTEMAGTFDLLSGVLSPNSQVSLGPGGGVVLSSLSGGAAESRAQRGLSIKYVASGTEVYRYGGRPYAVGANQFLIVPEGIAGDVEVRRTDGASTWGLCMLLPPSPRLVTEHGLDEPMLFPAACSDLGMMLARSLRKMKTSTQSRAELSKALVDTISGNLESCLEDATRSLDRLHALKSATRYEALRRLNVARAYLHDVPHRTVELAELANVACMSRFHLLRSFRDCFGATPAAYHRRIRLERARMEILLGSLTCAEAAQKYGFADASSLSHAHVRMFGYPPTRNC